MKPEIHRSGEVIIKPINSIPKGAKLVQTIKSYIVGHSETGHHHVLKLAEPKLSVYEDKGILYLDVQQTGTLVHEKTGIDVHKSQKVNPGLYVVNIKKQFDYFLKKLTAVRD